jgi:hypothetical protein
MEPEKKTMYVTRYFDRRGIVEMEGYIVKYPGGRRAFRSGDTIFWRGRDAFDTAEKARTAAGKMLSEMNAKAEKALRGVEKAQRSAEKAAEKAKAWAAMVDELDI